MAKLRWHYGTMNCGKSAQLIQAAYNYQERGMQVIILKPSTDTREGVGVSEVFSRIGLRSEAILFNPDEDLFKKISVLLRDIKAMCIFVDEAQFMTTEQVKQLSKIVDVIDVPVMAYGLRTDFQGNLFPASAALFAEANKIIELRTICGCSKAATHVLRYNLAGNVIKEGPQVEVGGNDKYVAVCRKCHAEAMGYY